MTQVVSMVIVMFLLLNKTGKSHSVEDEKNSQHGVRKYSSAQPHLKM
jgi:hypothetical protein